MEQKLPFCPVETTLTLIGDKWKVIIIRDLMDGTKRFGELKKTVGKVTQKVLTANLRQMEEMGLVSRKVYAEVPPRVEYTLTETGYSLKPILDAMSVWGIEYKRKLGCSLNCELLGEQKDIALVQSTLIYIDHVSLMIELIDTVKHETGCQKMIIYRSNLSDDFFKLSNKLASEIISKCSDYKVKVAVIGDYSHFVNKDLQAFIEEQNTKNDFIFVSDNEEAIKKLND